MFFLRTVMAVGVALVSGQAVAAPLLSPWDKTTVAVTTKGYSCPSAEALPKSIEASSFYSDDKHSVIDEKKYAAYKAADDRFQGAMKETESAADDFRASGSKAAAECVLRLLVAQANAKAMTGEMSSNQAYYVQNWTLGGLAVSWLKVRSAMPGTAEERKSVTAWMDTVGTQVRTYFSERHTKLTKDGTNNHYYWAGFAAAGAAIAADDRSLYDWGLGTYDEALSRAKPDGTLPLEMDRGQKALHYHLFALAPIVMLAEFGEANGQGTYARKNGIVHMMVKRTIAGLVDNSYFTKAAGAAQDTPEKGEIKSNDVIWLVPYLKRFPDAECDKILKRAKLHADNYLGGLPPGWGGK